MLNFESFVKKPTKQSTLSFIKQAHGGQKYGNDPYWTHPVAVAKLGKKFFGSRFTDEAYMTALLHDVVEDTRYNIDDLRKMGYSENIVKAIELLTKNKKISYMSNIENISNSESKIAMMVKFSDNYHNYTGKKEGAKWTPEHIAHSQAKYLKSLTLLASKLNVDLKEIIS